MNFAAIENIKVKSLEYIRGLSLREKLAIGIVVVVVVILGLDRIYEPISDAFAAQRGRFDKAQTDAQKAYILLDRYAKLKSRKDEVEKEYRQVEFKEGALSYLENLVRNKAGISSGFTIKDLPPSKFGGTYEQSPFSIKFTIVSYERLVDFLKEIVHGEKPFVLSKLDIRKSRRGDSLDVDLDAMSIRQAKTGEG